MSHEIGTTRFKPHDLILCRKVFDPFSHGSGTTEAFFSDQIGCETSDVGSCCAHIRVSKAWEVSGGGGGGLTHGGTAQGTRFVQTCATGNVNPSTCDIRPGGEDVDNYGY